jgi:hypothetical protein
VGRPVYRTFASKLVRGFEEWNGASTADNKLALCKKRARKQASGGVDGDEKRTRRQLTAILGDSLTVYKLLSDNAELGSALFASLPPTSNT